MTSISEIVTNKPFQEIVKLFSVFSLQFLKVVFNAIINDKPSDTSNQHIILYPFLLYKYTDFIHFHIKKMIVFFGIS